MSPPGIGLTSASWIAYSTMNGLMNASVSAGSSHRGASVTWRPHVSVPAGEAIAAGPVHQSRSGSTSTATSERASRLIASSSAAPVRARSPAGGRQAAGIEWTEVQARGTLNDEVGQGLAGGGSVQDAPGSVAGGHVGAGHAGHAADQGEPVPGDRAVARL